MRIMLQHLSTGLLKGTAWNDGNGSATRLALPSSSAGKGSDRCASGESHIRAKRVHRCGVDSEVVLTVKVAVMQ